MKEGKQKTGGANGHQFVAASGPPGPSVCVACDRPVPGKDLLQCFSEFLLWARAPLFLASV